MGLEQPVGDISDMSKLLAICGETQKSALTRLEEASWVVKLSCQFPSSCLDGCERQGKSRKENRCLLTNKGPAMTLEAVFNQNPHFLGEAIQKQISRSLLILSYAPESDPFYALIVNPDSTCIHLQETEILHPFLSSLMASARRDSRIAA